jgi:hypothetical protein
MKMPNADDPEENVHKTGACLEVDGALMITRRVTDRFCRSPWTAAAYPLRVFSPIFFLANASASAAEPNFCSCF